MRCSTSTRNIGNGNGNGNIIGKVICVFMLFFVSLNIVLLGQRAGFRC